MKKFISFIFSKAGKIILPGVVLIIAALLTVPDIWISENDLLLVEGEVSSADYYITKTTDNRGRASNISEVIFYLRNTDYQFLIRKNIGQDFHYDPHQKIQQQLRHSDGAKVWIKKSDVENYQPDIYKLNAGNIQLISLDDVKDKYRGDYMLFMVLGIIMISIPFFMYYFSEDNVTDVKES